jgi:hypothetical protein
MKTESAGGFPTPPVGSFTEGANLGTSELGAKGHAYSPECVGGILRSSDAPFAWWNFFTKVV